MASRKATALAKEVERLREKRGPQSAFTAKATKNFKYETISTGIWALDVALGTGGFVKGAPVEIYGPPDIGKSSSVGFSVIREAIAQDNNCGIIAVEPSFDPYWAEKHGVDLDRVAIYYPDNGEEAFEVLYEWVSGGVIDFVLFDSIGALLSENEYGNKPKVGGQSGMITWGVKQIPQVAFKNKVGVVFLNQVRDDMDAQFSLLDSPGGHAVKHLCPQRIEMKTGKDQYKIKEGTGKEKHDVLIGRTLVAHIQRNKLSEGTKKRAQFDYYQMEVDGYPFGVDRAKDISGTGLRTGVFSKSGNWYNHELFPNGKLNGANAAGQYVLDNPEVYKQVRAEVEKSMFEKAGLPKDIEPLEDHGESGD